MNQLNRNFDLLAVLILVLLLGVAQAPRMRAASMLRVARIVDATQDRVIPRIQKRILNGSRIPHIERLVFTSPE
jgi:hypothetical protein